MIHNSVSDLRRPCEWRDEVAIVPFSGIQILDFGFDLEASSFRRMRFVERTTEAAPGGMAKRTLIPFTGDAAEDEKIEAQSQSDDEEYSIRPEQALETFLGKWIPVPVLRKRNAAGPGGEEQFDLGPSAWARLRVTELLGKDAATGHTHRVQLAIDTNLSDQGESDLYLAPAREDSEQRREFRFCSAPRDMDWFLRRHVETASDETIDPQRWVSDWLDEMFMDCMRGKRPGRAFGREHLRFHHEHLARYLALLALIDCETRIPLLRLADTISERDAARPVEVDLVLDVGNSRTCGILIESFPDDAGDIDLTRSYPLQLRDLGEPERHYCGLLESRVEFASAEFGSERHSRASGLARAFVWPSIVRVGPEAMRMIGEEEGTETASGLSSPKRYLWDDTPLSQDWRFQGSAGAGALPSAARAAMARLNETGDVIEQVRHEKSRRLRRHEPEDEAICIRPRFSRSSLYGFMIQELLAHALVQINDPASRADRAQSDLPRRLRRVILTLPTATSIQEQAIIRSRAEGAMRLLAEMQGFDESASRTTAGPELVVEWDEASCTQLVYLYSEIAQRFDGQMDAYLEMIGRPRPREPGGSPAPSLRLASIDVGGGTSDLMVTAYHSEANKLLHPKQLFREGFRIAGDDMLEAVVARIVLPGIRDSVEARGGRNALARIKELFGPDVAGAKQREKDQRRKFALRALAPLAVAVLEQAETVGPDGMTRVNVADALGSNEVASPQARDAPAGEASADEASDDGEAPGAGPGTTAASLDLPDQLLAYLEEPVRESGAEGWSFAETEIVAPRNRIDEIVREILGKAIGNMCEIIGHLGCDVILLTGRPSRLPALRSLVEEQMVVRPDRLVSMHDYRAGAWYPYRSPATDRIGDPKSTVAVGGMLVALAAGWLPNFRLDSGALRMRSTVRYIGVMESHDRISEDNVLFSDIDHDARGDGLEAEVPLYAPMHLGARQLPLERWTTTPLYHLDFATQEARGRPTPLTIRLEREVAYDGGEELNSEDALRREAAQEAFRVTEVIDGEQMPMKNSEVSLKLNTLGSRSEYWLDDGEIQGI